MGPPMECPEAPLVGRAVPAEHSVEYLCLGGSNLINWTIFLGLVSIFSSLQCTEVSSIATGHTTQIVKADKLSHDSKAVQPS